MRGCREVRGQAEVDGLVKAPEMGGDNAADPAYDTARGPGVSALRLLGLFEGKH